MIRYCHHIGLFTGSPWTLIAFYCDDLGFSVLETKSVGRELMETVFGVSSACELTKLGMDRAVVEVFSPSEGEIAVAPPVHGGLNHWSLGVDDKAAYVRFLEERGVALIKLEGRGKTLVFVKDPDGNVIEICENGKVHA